MRRREAIAGLVGAVLGTAPARAQPGPTPGGIPVVLFLAPVPLTTIEFLRAGLAKLGYVEGRTLLVESRIGDVSQIGLELARRKVDVIFAASPQAVRAAWAATRTVPIVAYDLESDPIEAGYAESFATPTGNVTGVFLDQPELAGKWLQYVRQAVPGASRIAALWDPRTTPSQARAIESAGAKLPVQVEVFELAADLDAVFAQIARAGAQGLVILSSPIAFGLSGELARLTAQMRLPAIFMFREFVDAGGLLSYGPEFHTLRPRFASFVDSILRGRKPGDIPLESPDRFELVVNAKTAAALGLTLPPLMLREADEVIE
jgi:putative ABC transport system substrate-binding protein